MSNIQFLLIAAMAVFIPACGTLEKKSILISAGDSKEKVISIMGLPGDRQFRGKHEAWQYGQTGAGFGYHDFRLIWFYNGKVTGITSYKNYAPATSAAAHFIEIRWEDAPNR